MKADYYFVLHEKLHSILYYGLNYDLPNGNGLKDYLDYDNCHLDNYVHGSCRSKAAVSTVTASTCGGSTAARRTMNKCTLTMSTVAASTIIAGTDVRSTVAAVIR